MITNSIYLPIKDLTEYFLSLPRNQFLMENTIVFVPPVMGFFVRLFLLLEYVDTI